jgi:hypothetical protein
MPTQVDPAAFTNAFNLAVDRGQQERQLGIQNTRARLHDMYMANQEQRAAAAEGRAAQDQTNQQTQFTQEQQLEVLKRLNMASAEVAQNPTAIGRWGPELEKAGDLGPNWRQMSPQELQAGAKQLFESTSAALLAYERGGSDGQSGSKMGAYQPGDYTTESWAKFASSGDPSQLVRYNTPRQDYSPSFQNVTRTRPDGSTEQGTFDTRTGSYSWSGNIVPAGQKARAEATGKAEGEAVGSQAAKTPAQASMEYVLGRFEKQLPKTMQGGIGGVTGKVGSVFDYKDKQSFENLREQLSTEIRTVFRIPGEGTLSDREQQQYGVQLPSTNNHPDVNQQILADIRERTRLRLQTPVSQSAQPQTVPQQAQGGVRRYNPQTGKIE